MTDLSKIRVADCVFSDAAWGALKCNFGARATMSLATLDAWLPEMELALEPKVLAEFREVIANAKGHRPSISHRRLGAVDEAFSQNDGLIDNPPEEAPKVRAKASYVGAPAIFALEMACQDLSRAFDSYGVYLVGSALVRPDYRDVDLRMIMEDDAFTALFPDAHGHSFQFDTRWLLLSLSISERLGRLSGLKVDFQFQPQSYANSYHKGERQAIGLIIPKREATA